jgi:Secretion system C-terminal sorting domain
MRKFILPLGIFLALALSVPAQELILDNTLAVNAQIAADTLADGSQAHSLYRVESGTYYYFDGSLDCDFDLVIEGPDNGWLYNVPDPPIFFQTPASDGSARDMINLNTGGSVVLKNILLTGLHQNDANISSFVRNYGGYKIVWDNCVFTDYADHATRSTAPTDEITITNCIFINADRRRYSPFGGMPFRLDAKSVVTFENNTLVNGARQFGNGGAVVLTSTIHEIHNSLLNQQVNGHEIQWYEALQANNIYYNWSFRGRSLRTNGYEAPFTTFETYANVANQLDSISLYEGNNLFYLDPAFFDRWTNVMNPTKADSDKVYQCYLWNVEVDSTILFDDNFTIGKNYWQVDPGFTVAPNNLDSMLAWMEANWAGASQPTNAPDWRVTSPVEWNPDGSLKAFNWPPAWDLSYTNTPLQAAGTDGLPLGDLNWFPSAKATYDANRDTYIAALRDSMTNATWVYTPGDSASGVTSVIVDVEYESSDVPANYYLSNNYPNPFNPSTTIKFGLPEQSDVTVSIFNVLGEKVLELTEQNLAAGIHSYNFNASQLSSGIYIFRLQATNASGKNFVDSRKMMLLK